MDTFRLQVLDLTLFLLHAALVLLILTGWVWQRTRRLHLLAIGLTIGSWIGLGAWYGWGYCPLTDWHWRIKSALGETALPASYIKYYADALTGRSWHPVLVDAWVVGLALTALLVSVVLNWTDRKRQRASASTGSGDRCKRAQGQGANHRKAPVACAPYTPNSRRMIKNALLALRRLLPGGLGKPRQPPTTVARVDLDRLLGTWFEVARLPNLEADGPWQCSVNVTATYTKHPDGGISVQTAADNAKARMRRSEVKGTVHPADASGSKLILRFFKLIRGDLWVIGLDPDYRWALMGTPSRKRLWLIARTPRLEAEAFQQAMAIADAQGYDAARVRPTAQQVTA